MLKGNVTIYTTTATEITGLEGATEAALIAAALRHYAGANPLADTPEIARYEILVNCKGGLGLSVWHDKDFLDVQHEERVEDGAPVFSLADWITE